MDRLSALLAFRLLGVAYVHGELPRLTPTEPWPCEAVVAGVVVVAPRREGMAGQAWQWAHEAAHALHPDTLAFTPGDERGEVLGPFQATERRIARRLGCLADTIEVQIDTLRRALHGQGPANPPSPLTSEERRIVARRLRRLERLA